MMKELAGIEKQINECLASAYNKGYKAGQEEGYETGMNDRKTLDADYKDGLEDGMMSAWNCAIHCMELGYGVEILKQYTASEAMAKLEECKKQTDDEIKVGDEVVIAKTGVKAVVSKVTDNELYNTVFYNGDTNCIDRRFIAKTGRHFPQIVELLEQLKGGNNGVASGK